MLDLMVKRDELVQKLNVIMQLIEKNKAELLVFDKLKSDIDELDEKKELLFRLTPNILMSNKGYFCVNIGSNVFLEKDKSGLKVYLEKKSEKIKNRIEELNKEIEAINIELKEIDEKLAKLLPQNPELLGW